MRWFCATRTTERDSVCAPNRRICRLAWIKNRTMSQNVTHPASISPVKYKKPFQNPKLTRLSCSIRLAQIRQAANSWKAWKCSPNRS